MISNGNRSPREVGDIVWIRFFDEPFCLQDISLWIAADTIVQLKISSRTLINLQESKT